jgi:heat shock protein HslJ
MRILLFGLLLAIATVSCRRPSTRLRETLTPIPNIPDYSRYLKAGDDVVAIGNEPAWSLTINPTKNTLRFRAPTGEPINTSAPERITDPNGSFRYTAEVESGRLIAIFRPDNCIDATSGQQFDYHVDVTVQGKSYTGCGLSLRQVALLQDNWVLTELNGKPISVGTGRERPRLEISLDEGRVTGTTGCNRLNGPIKADTHHLLIGPLATTRMACLEETGKLEGDFLKALQQPLTYRIGEGRLTLLRDKTIVLVFIKAD